jgi:hypothetical protein
MESEEEVCSRMSENGWEERGHTVEELVGHIASAATGEMAKLRMSWDQDLACNTAQASLAPLVPTW